MSKLTNTAVVHSQDRFYLCSSRVSCPGNRYMYMRATKDIGHIADSGGSRDSEKGGDQHWSIPLPSLSFRFCRCTTPLLRRLKNAL